MNRDFIRRLKEENYKYVPITLNTLAFILGMCVFIPLGKVSTYFKSECVLYSNPSISINENGVVTLDNDKTVWGGLSYCYFTTYCSVVVVIHAFIWCWFHIQTIRMREESQALPAMMISCVLYAIIFIILFCSSCIITAGKTTFCVNIRDNLQYAYECSETEDMLWSIFQGKKKFYTYLSLAEACSWLSVFLSLGQSAISGYKTVLMIKAKLSEEDSSDDDESLDTKHNPYRRFTMSESGSMTALPTVSDLKKSKSTSSLQKNSYDKSFKAVVC